MKLKTLTIMSFFAASLAQALPDSTDNLLRELVSGGELAKALKGHKGPFKEMRIKRENSFRDSAILETMCGPEINSKSASVLEVEFIFDNNLKEGMAGHTAYSVSSNFVTPGSAKNLKLCDGI